MTGSEKEEKITAVKTIVHSRWSLVVNGSPASHARPDIDSSGELINQAVAVCIDVGLCMAIIAILIDIISVFRREAKHVILFQFHNAIFQRIVKLGSSSSLLKFLYSTLKVSIQEQKEQS